MNETTRDDGRTDQKTAPSDDAKTLYNIDIQTAASPRAVADFADLLEAHGYIVVTDLQRGKMEIRQPADAGQPTSLEERIDAVVDHRLAEEVERTNAQIIDSSSSSSAQIHRGSGGGAGGVSRGDPDGDE